MDISREMAKAACHALSEKKAEEIRIIDISEISPLADYFVIASGNNVNHLRAMADEVEQKLFKAGVKLHHSEGYSVATWILLDFGNILVHLFNKEQREFYSLDHLWSDAKKV